jgi:hypothetical protein
MHWTGRVTAGTGVSLRSVRRIWPVHRFQPQRSASSFSRTNVPAKLVGLHLDPLQAPCSSQGQALDRPRGDLLMKKGPTRNMTDDLTRHDHIVHAAECPRRHGRRPVHGTLSATGIHPSSAVSGPLSPVGKFIHKDAFSNVGCSASAAALRPHSWVNISDKADRNSRHRRVLEPPSAARPVLYVPYDVPQTNPRLANDDASSC